MAGSLTGVPYRLRTPGLDPELSDRSTGMAAIPLPAGWETFDTACKRYGTTRFMALAGLFGATVACAAGRDNVIMSTPVAVRYDAATAGLLGCLINVVPVDVRVTARDTPRAAIAAGTKAVRNALRYADLPYQEIVRTVGPPLDSDDPLTNIGLEEFNAPTAEVNIGPLRVMPLGRAQVRLRHDLTLSVPRKDNEAPVLLYPSARWSAGRVADLAGDLAESITAAISDLMHNSALTTDC